MNFSGFIWIHLVSCRVFAIPFLAFLRGKWTNPPCKTGSRRKTWNSISSAEPPEPTYRHWTGNKTESLRRRWVDSEFIWRMGWLGLEAIESIEPTKSVSNEASGMFDVLCFKGGSETRKSQKQPDLSKQHQKPGSKLVHYSLLMVLDVFIIPD